MPGPPPIRNGHPIFPSQRPIFPGGGWFDGCFQINCGSWFWWGPFWWGPAWGLGWGWNGGMSGDVSGDYGYAPTGTFDVQGQMDSQPDSISQEPNPSQWQNPPDENLGDANAVPAAPAPVVTLYFKNGSVYNVTDYWLSGGDLHYLTTYGGENSIDPSQLDLQRTVDENAARGVTFSLRPAPEAAPAPESR